MAYSIDHMIQYIKISGILCKCVCSHITLYVVNTPCVLMSLHNAYITQLEVIKSYNPLLVSSQLSSVLASMPANKRTNSSGVKAAAKRKYQPPPMVCNSVC